MIRPAVKGRIIKKREKKSIALALDSPRPGLFTNFRDNLKMLNLTKSLSIDTTKSKFARKWLECSFPSRCLSDQRERGYNSRIIRVKCVIFVLSCLFIGFSSPSRAQVLSEEITGEWERRGEEKDALEFHPSFSVSERYQDNVRQEAFDRREDDFSVQWRPGLELEYNGDRHRHELDYFSRFTRYHHLHDEDTNTHHVALTDNFNLGGIIEFTVNTTDDFRSEQQDLLRGERRSNYLETNYFTVNPTLRINVLEHTSLVGFYTYFRTSILEEGREDYLSNTFGGSVNQEFLDAFELFGGYRYREQEFFKSTPGFIDRVIFGGLNWDITSTLRLEGEYGFSIRRYERNTAQVPDSATENDVWEMTIRNDITETTHVDISYSRSQEVREITATELVLRDTVYARFRHVLGNLFIINLVGSYTEEDFEFTDRRDVASDIRLFLETNFSEIIFFRVGGGYGNNYAWPAAVRENVYIYQAGAAYRPIRWLAGSVDYEHRETDNNSSGDETQFRTEFVQNSVTVSVTASF
jgi:hypothetical protein